MRVIPITLKRANEVVAEWHRHNKPVRGCRFCLGAEDDAGALIGVVIIGRPVARMLDQQKVAEVLRLCTMPEAPKNACSFLYAAARRTWATMGGTKIVTYTLASEPGASLRGAGWVPAATITGGQWTRGSRPRETQEVFDLSKTRWEANT